MEVLQHYMLFTVIQYLTIGHMKNIDNLLDNGLQICTVSKSLFAHLTGEVPEAAGAERDVRRGGGPDRPVPRTGQRG